MSTLKSVEQSDLNICDSFDTDGSCNFIEDVPFLLTGLNLAKYIDVFKENGVDLDIFVGLTENDLKLLGIEDEKERQKFSYKGSKRVVIEEKLEYNSAEEKLILQNVLYQAKLLDNSIKKLFDRIKKREVKDYFVSDTQKASGVLRIITGNCLKVTENITNQIYHPPENGIINDVLKKSNISFPEFLKNQFRGKPKFRKDRFILILSAIGVCSFACLLTCLKNFLQSYDGQSYGVV